MQRTNVLIIGALLLSAGSALAQGTGDGSGSASAGAGGEVGGGAGSGSAAVGVDAGGGAMAGGNDQLISAPLTLGKGWIGITGDFEVLRINIPPIPPATMGVSATAEGLGVGLGYGISDKLEAGLSYFIQVNPDGSAKGPLDLYAGFTLLHKDKLDVAAGADFAINLANTDAKAINAGLAVRYLVAPKIALFTGNPVAPGPVGQHLSISLASNGPITFAVPVGVALQASPKAYAFLDTEVARFSISNSANAFIFADFIPIDVGLLFRAMPGLDIGAHFADDLKAAGDAYEFGVLARFYKH
jgi:hypothetical protein